MITFYTKDFIHSNKTEILLHEKLISAIQKATTLSIAQSIFDKILEIRK